MDFLFSQICGLIVAASAIASMQLKSIKATLACLLVCNGVGAVSYILLGGFSGSGIYLVALVQTVVYFIFRVKNKKAPRVLAAVFVLAYVICSLSTYQAPVDILSALAALTCALGLIQEKPSAYRAIMLANGLIWSVYDLKVGAYTMILSHAATVISAIVGMIRIDLKIGSRQKPKDVGK